MNEEILKNIWNQLTADGMTTSDFETWKNNFAGSEEIQQNVHTYLFENGMTKNDLETWSSNVGLKKKEPEVKNVTLDEFLDTSTSAELLKPDPSTLAENQAPIQINEETGEVIIPEVLEEDLPEPEPKPYEALSFEDKKAQLEKYGLNVDSYLQEARAGSDLTRFSKSELREEFKGVASMIDMATTDEEAVDMLYNKWMMNRSLAPMNLSYEGEKKINKKRKDVELDPEYTTNIDPNQLEELNINKEDYLKWESTTQREEGGAYKFLRDLLKNKEGIKYDKEKSDFQKLSFYKTEIIQDIVKDIEKIDAKILSGNFNEADIERLEKAKANLNQEFIKEYSSLLKLGDMFPTMKKYDADRDLNRRKKLYEAGQEGGGNYAAMEAIDIAKRVPDVIQQFAMTTAAFIPSSVDQVLSFFGADKKGIFAGLNEMILDSSEGASQTIDAAQRQGVAQGKTVIVDGKEYFVTYDFNENPIAALDGKTGVRMEGIISDDKIKKIIEKSKTIPNIEDKWFGGAFTSNTMQTLANLMALIKGGKNFQKYMGASPSLGIGLASYTSQSARQVEDMKNDLIAAGVPEKEAYDKAILAGNAIASLDGIFTGLAGSNEKLLGATTTIKTKIREVIKNKGKDFSKKQLAKAFVDIGEEMKKEVFIEELPVYFSEKVINRINNWAAGTIVRNADINSAEIKEVIAMTVIATGGLGGTRLLKPRERSDAIRFLARSTRDVDGLIKELVSAGDITLEQAQDLKGEIYDMQVAELKTQGEVVNTDNMVEASDLLQKRQQLLEKRKSLEGPLKEKVDQEIENIDVQINEVMARDKAQTQEILNNEANVQGKVTREKEEEVKPEITDEQVVERIKTEKGSDVYTQQEFDNMKNVMIKEQAVETQKETEVVTPEVEVEAEQEIITPQFTDQEVVDRIKREKGSDVYTQQEFDNMKNVMIKEAKQEAIERAPLVAEQEQVREDIGKIPETKTKKEIIKRAPSVNKILGKKSKKITVNEAVVLKDQIKLEARAAREAKQDLKKKRKSLMDRIKQFEGAGVITTKQTKAITNVLNRVNLDNPSSVNKAMDYVEKVIQNADNIQKLKDANSIRAKIKKAYKRKGVEANLSDAAGSFININPNQVSDIDAYIEQATQVLEGIRPSRVVKDGIKVRPTFDIKSVNQYTSDTMLEQDKKDMDAKKELFEEITGLEATDFTLEEMQDILYGELKQDAIDKKIEVKEKTIRDGVKKAYDSYSSVVNSIIEKGKDPFTGQKIDLTSKEKKLVKDFLNVDVDTLSTKDALAYVDSLINFATNQTTGGMQVVVDRNKGRLGMESFNKPENKAKSLSSVAQLWLKNLATLPNVFDRIFKSPRIALEFMKKSGLNGFIDGSSKANTETRNLTDSYIDKYGKTKPNGKSFNDVENITERGLGAFMSRSVETDQETEFNRRKKLVEQSIEELNKGNKDDKRKAQEYQKAYDKLLKDSKTIEDVQSKMDNTNLEATKWWMTEWSNIYDNLAEVSLNTYNSVLGKDINYTPDSFINVEQTKADPEQELGQPNFTDTRTRIYDKKSGVLMPTTKPNVLPKGKIVNLNFDSQNVSSYRGALTDIKTAGSVQQMIGAVNSKAFQEIFPDKTSRQVAYDRIRNFVDLKRGQAQAINETVSKWTRRFNRLSGLGTSRVLGGPTQFVKQLVPIINTVFNAGGINMAQALALINNADVNKLINESGKPIANRGIESQTTTSFNSALDAEAKTSGGKLIDGISKVNNAYLKTFLVSADRLAARSSFIAYYLKDLKKQGIDTSNIDWSSHKLNDQAADYAQQQVDRQQNVSDADLQGDLFSSRDLDKVAIRKIFFPFANFVLNQKTRMYNDIMTVTSKTSSSQDKAAAARSLGGLVAETATFNTIGFFVTQMLGNIAREMVGYDEDREEEQKRVNNQIKGRLTTVARDIFSPIPYVDSGVVQLVNLLLPENLELYGNRTREILDDLGTLGIGGKNIVKAAEMLQAGLTGEYTSTYAGKKTKRKLTSKQKEAALTVSMAYILYSGGLLPSEAGYIGDQAFKYATKAIPKSKKKKPMSKTKMKKYTPDLYESLYGKGGALEEIEKLKADIRKEVREATR